MGLSVCDSKIACCVDPGLGQPAVAESVGPEKEIPPTHQSCYVAPDMELDRITSVTAASRGSAKLRLMMNAQRPAVQEAGVGILIPLVIWLFGCFRLRPIGGGEDMGTHDLEVQPPDLETPPQDLTGDLTPERDAGQDLLPDLTSPCPPVTLAFPPDGHPIGFDQAFVRVIPPNDPMGIVTGLRICSTAQGLANLGPNLCPDQSPLISLQTPFYVLPLKGPETFWKAWSVCNQAHSADSEIRKIITDSSFFFRLEFNGDLKDSSGNNNDGMASVPANPGFLANGGTCNGRMVNNINGQAACFDGVDDEVTIPHSNRVNIGQAGQGFMIMYRFQTTDLGLKDHVELFIKLGPNRGIQILLINANDGVPEAVRSEIVDNPTNAGASSVAGSVDQKWHHFLVTVFNGVMTMYFDGQRRTAANYPNMADFSSTEDITIGATSIEPRFFRGIIDYARAAKITRDVTDDEAKGIYCVSEVPAGIVPSICVK